MSTGGPTGDLVGWSNAVRAGAILDTRDREVGPSRGMWAELIVQGVDRALGSDGSYWRITLADRHYVPVGSRLTLAQRVLVQSIIGDAPYTGKSLALSNTELR